MSAEILVTVDPDVQIVEVMTPGPEGPGAPRGGATNQVVAKASDADLDFKFVTLTPQFVGAEPVITSGTTSDYWRGDKIWRNFFADVRAATLTGLSTAVNAVVTAADTVLSAIGKLQAQITGLASSKLDVAATSFGGNAATATKLQTARAINGTSFDGSANITTTIWGPSRTLTIGNTGKSVDGSADVSWSLEEIGATNADGNYIVRDTRAVDTPTDLGLAGVKYEFKCNSTDGLNDGGVYHAVMTFQPWHDSSGGNTHQLGFTNNGNLWLRAAPIGGTWGPWREIAFLDAPAFTSATFSGNVGIGTSSPGAMLDVAGEARVRYAGGSSGSVGITLGNLSASSTLTGNYHINFSNEQDIPVAHIRSNVYGDGSSRLAFGITPAGSRTADRRQTNMWLSPDGLWVGSTDSTVAHVRVVDGISNGGVGYISVGHTSGVADGNWYHAFWYGNSVIGTITQATTSSVAYNTTSDRRLKTNIAPAPDAGPVIDGIEVVSHDWKLGGHTRFGVIAQDLHTVYPEAVTPGDDADGGQVERPWSVDYSKLVPLMIREIQSLRARVAALEAKEKV